MVEPIALGLLLNRALLRIALGARRNPDRNLAAAAFAHTTIIRWVAAMALACALPCEPRSSEITAQKRAGTIGRETLLAAWCLH